MTTLSPASAEPISAADREKVQGTMKMGVLIHKEAIWALPAYEARVVELEAALQTMRSGFDDLAASAATMHAANKRLIATLVTSEARATALLEAAKPFVRHYDASWMHKWADEAQSSTFSRHTFGELRALVAAINAGAPEMSHDDYVNKVADL